MRLASLAIPGVVSLALAVTAGGAVATRELWPWSPITRGVMLDDRRFPEGRGVEGRDAAMAWLEERRAALGERRLSFRLDGKLTETTFTKVGIELDVDATFSEAKRVGHEGSWGQRMAEGRRARRGLVDVAPRWRFDRDTARAFFKGLAPDIAKAPVDAHVDIMKHERTPDEPGRELDVEAAVARLEAAARSGGRVEGQVVDLPVRAIPASVTLGALTTVNVEKVVSAWETTFSLYGTGAGRAINIRRAASLFDGKILVPGQTFSFNETVGPRTRDRGFALAPEILGDEMQPGYGGGTCQASTTLYAAAVFGALDILERQSHSRPSHYAQLGLDATVSYPLADLKIRNALPFAILIHAFLPNPTTVRVEILGGDPVAKVDYAFGVSGTEDFFRRIQVKDSLAPGQRVLHQKGVMGFDVNSVVRLHYFDGRQDERRYFSGYRPAPEIYWVAPGYDPATMPPLPEHAAGVEGVDMVPRIGG